MNNSYLLKVRTLLLNILITSIIIAIGYFIINGIPLAKIPQAQDVSYVEVTDIRLNNTTVKLTQTKDIENAVNVMSFLRRTVGAPKPEKPVIEFKFYLNDGREVSVTANKNTVYYDEKSYKIKASKGDLFIKIVEGLFFKD